MAEIYVVSWHNMCVSNVYLDMQRFSFLIRFYRQITDQLVISDGIYPLHSLH